jgi:NAD(P)-dependent dehydrogenase (short-subunit alcohol dehydrogenase family)
MTTWFITGCSSGLGRAFAEEVLAGGDEVVVTARDVATVRDLEETHPDRALAVALDVTDRAQATAAVERALERFGRIDVLVNNAGYGYRAAVEEGEDEAIERLFATNVLGPVGLTQAVLPGMRARRSGTIVNVSSIGARACPPGSGFYSASKAALEALSASLRREVRPLGIRVMVVEPGAFRTDFSGRSLTQSVSAIEDYRDTAGRRRKEHDDTHGTQEGDPAAAARVLVETVRADDVPFMLLLGPDAVERFRATQAGLAADVDAHEERSRSTSFPA